MIDIRTHDKIDTALCGTPVDTGPGRAAVEMTATDAMAVDSSGLVHGGFIFGLADHAAMIAVNHPHVVLAGAEVKFMKPVRAGEKVRAEAVVADATGRRRTVRVHMSRGGDTVFEGTFICSVLDRHVLDTGKE